MINQKPSSIEKMLAWNDSYPLTLIYHVFEEEILKCYASLEAETLRYSS
jgi:hypothetical protein